MRGSHSRDTASCAGESGTFTGEPFHMPELRRLNVFTAAPYEPMTFPYFQPRLKDLSSQGLIVAIGGSCEGRPVALGLAEVSPDGRSGNILSAFVARAHRSRGIGTALLARLEDELRSRGCTELDLAYLTETPATLAIEMILKKRGWTPPQARMLICRADRRIFEAPWIKRRRLPAGFSIFPWCELTPNERNAMQRQQELHPWYPEMLSPFRDEAMQEPENSLGLRRQGQVVGWLITHRISPKMIRYSSLFVRAELRARGCALPLLAEAIDRQARCRGLDSFGSFSVWLDNDPMVRFARRLAPYLLSVRESRGSRKYLLEEPSPPTA